MKLPQAKENGKVARGNPPALPQQTQAITLTAESPSGFDFDLTDVLPRPSSTLTTLTTVPPECLAYTSATGECKGTMTASNVTFDDCASPFTVCRCVISDSASVNNPGGDQISMDLGVAVDMLARVPVGLRRYIATTVLMPDSTPHAYTLTTGDVHMFAQTAVETWIHEVSLHLLLEKLRD